MEHTVGDRRSEDLRDSACGTAGGPAISRQEAAAEAGGDKEPLAATAAGAERPAVGIAALLRITAADAAVVL